jgi:predicted DNA-binding helix-hairpin-helix protein
MDIRRCSLGPEQVAKVFMDYYQRKKVFGLFLSSSVIGSADVSMEKLIAAAKILRKKYQYRGYIHLKVIPGASEAAITEAVSLSSAVSINIETPGQKNLAKLTNKKNYIKDIIEPMKLISNLTAKGNKYSRVKQTTQFIVGAAAEKDAEIVKYLYGLYDRLKLQRVYFSAYQKGLGEISLPGEKYSFEDIKIPFVREHRLYQVDFLFRKYGFKEADIGLDNSGNLSIDKDPKQIWADRHPEFFPVDINRGDRNALLRVPGLGPVTVNRILSRRKTSRLRDISDVAKINKTLQKARKYLCF